MTEKLNITRIFNAIWDLYKENAGILLTTALVIYLAAAIVVGLFFLVSPVLAILGTIIVFVATFWYQGMVIELVNRIHGNQPRPTVGTLFRAVGPKIGPLIGAGILAGLGITIGLILLIVPGLYLITIWAVLSPVIVIEGARVGQAFGRSQHLVKGNGWPVFGTVVILSFLSLALGQTIGVIFGRDTFFGGMLSTFVPGLVFAPVGALAAAVLYFELRRVKEGTGASAPVTASPDAAAAAPPR